MTMAWGFIHVPAASCNTHLLHNLCGGQVTQEAHAPRVAELAVHRAPNLQRHTTTSGMAGGECTT
jgi:hypothetical protein